MRNDVIQEHTSDIYLVARYLAFVCNLQCKAPDEQSTHAQWLAGLWDRHAFFKTLPTVFLVGSAKALHVPLSPGQLAPILHWKAVFKSEWEPTSHMMPS